jgi:hypothetical protein
MKISPSFGTRLALILIATTVLATFASAPTVRAAATPGLVCIADRSTTNCPSTPIVLTGTSGSTLTIAVNIQSSASLNGFDIIVKADTRVLQPVSDDLTGSVLGSSPLILANCVEGLGAGCSSQTGAGIVRVAGVIVGSSTTAPTTGRLFSITYNVLASASNIKVGFQAGCSNTSVQPDYCVTVVDGSVVVPETVQESTGVIGDFSLQASPTTVILPRGGSIPFQIFFFSVGGFSGGISFTWTISPLRRQGPTLILLSSNIINLLPGTFTDELFAAQAGRLTPNGSYTFTLTANAGTLTHTIQVTIVVVRS